MTSRALALTAVIVVGAAVFPQGHASAEKGRAVRCPQARGYAGVVGPSPAAGVAAEVTTLATPVVRWGHVAAWVGLSSGVVGSGAWIQAGISGFVQGQTTLYYEVASSSTGPVYHLLAYDVPTDEPHELAVREEPSAPGSWRVWLDGVAVSPVVDMPGSHGLWRPMVMAESWNGPGAGCNVFRFAFAKLEAQARSGGAWRTLARAPRLLDRGYRLVSSGGTLVASGG